MKFFPKETQPNGFRKETSGHQENQVAWDGKGKKKTHKIVIHLYTPVQIIGQKQKYRKRNAGSIPLRP